MIATKVPFSLPRHTDPARQPELPPTRQITLIGANGSGKTKFMNELINICGNRAYKLSALSASFPEMEASSLEGSIDKLYEAAANSNALLRADAVSEIDKLCYLLFIDEFDYLMTVKTQRLSGDENVKLKATKLDKVIRLWKKIFPGHEILRVDGSWRFKTDAGEDTVPADTLSQGEKTVLYYIAATLYAMPEAVIFIDQPQLFLHPAILNNLWNSIEALRPDCTFVYNTTDADFVSSRTENVCIWVKGFNASDRAWDYEVLSSGQISDDLFIDIIGTRRPVLFIEGDATHSIDAKLYTLVFSNHLVRPLGSCNKVIETTRTFNDLKQMHHLDSRGIVDRDRRSDEEVAYLRLKNIMVPEVAEIENIFLLPEVIINMALKRKKNPQTVFNKVRHTVMRCFESRLEEQVMQHVRHKMKRDVERKIDGKFTCITALETHMKTLIYKLKPREYYNQLMRDFLLMLEHEDYYGVLKVFNYKPMLPESNVAELLGFASKDHYIKGVLGLIKSNSEEGHRIREAIQKCLDGTLRDAAVHHEELLDIDPPPFGKHRKKKNKH